MSSLGAADNEYTGTVTSLLVSQYKTGSDAYYYGSIIYVAGLGEITRPGIRDSKGKIVRKGTMLYSLNLRYWQQQLEGSKELLTAGKMMLKETLENFKRYQVLVKPGATSEEIYENYFSLLSSSYDSYLNDEASYMENQEFLKASYQVASFEGIVDQVLYNQGLTSENAAALEVTMLNPIGITVKMPRSKARQIGINTPVKVIPSSSGEPQGIYYGYSMLTPDGITFVTANAPLYTPDSKGLRAIRNVVSVTKFYIDLFYDTLAVSDQSVLKDKKGEFVWKVNHIQGSQFKLEKVYIKTLDMYRLKNGAIRLQALAETAGLKLNDLVVNNPAKDLKDGEMICIPQPKYLLMPGDQVKVIIGK